MHRKYKERSQVGQAPFVQFSLVFTPEGKRTFSYDLECHVPMLQQEDLELLIYLQSSDSAHETYKGSLGGSQGNWDLCKLF